MKKMIVVGIMAIVVIMGIVALLMHKSPTYTSTGSNSSSSSSSNSSNSSSSSSSSSTLSSSSMSPNFTINANDSSADHETISVKQGASVSLTFAVETNGTYHGGLQFVSTDPSINSGPIAPGASKTVTFTASKSFSFQPYWYASQVKKDYLVTVNVTE